MSDLFKADIYERMRRLDEDVNAQYQGDGRFQIIIVGGGALVLRGYLTRSTDDIDIINADKRLYSLMVRYDMNGDVDAYMNNFPYNYEDRIELLFSASKIDYYTASLEDIIIAKLCSNREDDLTDIEKLAHNVNWDILEKLALDEGELKANILSDRSYMDFLASYERFKGRFHLCES